MQNDDNKSAEKQPGKSKKKRKTTRELTREHIRKKDHVITEEDFKNVKLGADVKDDLERLDLPEDKDRPRDEDKDPKIVTPWDVIS